MIPAYIEAEMLDRLAAAERSWQFVCATLGQPPCGIRHEDYITNVIASMEPLVFVSDAVIDVSLGSHANA